MYLHAYIRHTSTNTRERDRKTLEKKVKKCRDLKAERERYAAERHRPEKQKLI